jgi:flap endonuclease-1
MGIKDLTAFLKEHAPNSISKGNLSQFTNQFPKGRRLRAAIDTSLFMYKYKYKNGDNFIIDFLEQINRLLINNIEPIYIFDGAPPLEKFDTLKLRKERKIGYQNKIKLLESHLENMDSFMNSLSNEDKDNTDENQITKIKTKAEVEKELKEEIIKIKRKTISVTNDDIRKLKYFLDIMNIRHIKKNMEADIVCSKLSSLGLVDFIISEDMDHLTSGTQILLRDFNNRNNYVTIYELDKALNTLNISNENWINLCILFGCDYVQRIKGLGYKTSYKFLSTNLDKNFEELVEVITKTKKCNLPDNYLEKVGKAQTIFRNNIDIEIDESFFTENKDIFDNQVQVVKDYLKKYTKFTDQKIKNRIKNIFGYCI